MARKRSGRKPSKKKKPYDQVGAIIEYETGGLDESQIIELFQNLVDTGMAWQLQGHYGRMAVELIEGGFVHR